MLPVVLLSALGASCVLYSIWSVLYNLYFHPLVKFPGPWWAGATSYAEAYFDIVKGGLYFKEIEAMHARYGPIVRVSPDELSIRDAEFYEHIYGGMNSRRELDLMPGRQTGAPTSIISTIDHDHHRVRRTPLLPFFSKKSIAKLEPFIWSRVNLLAKKLKQAHKSDRVITILDAYGALTTDVISQYAYGESFDCLGKDTDFEFKNDYMHAISKIVFAQPFRMHFPLLTECMRLLPLRIMQAMSPGMACMNDLRQWCARSAVKALKRNQLSKTDDSKKPETIFEALIGPSMPPEEKTPERLTDEGFVILSAGLETTARFLTNITARLLLNPECMSKLRAELKTAMPVPGDCPPCSVLENLPYLSAVVAEGLRCETILANRFTRKLVEPLPYNGFIIPPGAVVGCSPYLQNHCAEVFPDPDIYRPERWIEARERGENLNKYLGTFVKGGRMCLGINLAYAELHLTIAAIFRNLEIELVDSGLENITMKRAYTFGFTDNYDWGVKIRVTNFLD